MGDPRLNQPDTYCVQCGELCGRGSVQVMTDWYCQTCYGKDDDKAQEEKP